MLTLMTRLGLGVWDGFRGRGMRCGRPGEGGGEEKTRWLKLKRDEVADSGTFSCVYDAALRRLMRGGDTIILGW